MKLRINLKTLLILSLTLPVAACMILSQGGGLGGPTPARPEGPCDIYAAGGTPCVAAHSSTRALYAAYNGPLYQVMRQSDNKTRDIGVVKPSPGDAGGYADADAQDAFCANTYCWVTTLYDQSEKKNHLIQPPRGGFAGPALGGFNNLPIADMAPVTLMGHKVYGIYIEPGMGLRQNDPKGTAVDDQAEGQYWVINGHHYNNGCCFDYGNAETDSRDDGNGTMETTYYGNSTGWYRGQGNGPWIMTDQENNLVGCVNPNPQDKLCADLPSIAWRFVTATADGEPHHWRSMGGDSQTGQLRVMFDGQRINNTYDPMRKQGAILLGNGGDNSNGSQGTYYEGAMTAPNTFPSAETNQKIQANVVAARYGVQRVLVSAATAIDAPHGLQTFSPGSTRETAVTFTNTTGVPASGVKLSLKVPSGWTAVVTGTTDGSKTFAEAIAPGASVSAVFKVTSSRTAFNGDIVGLAAWTSNDRTQSETMAEKVRNVGPVTINEYASNYIELYNSGTAEIDISNWSLTHHAREQAIFSSVKVPAGTKLASKGFYLMGLANSGLAVQAQKGDATIHVRSVAGFNVGDTIEVGNETRKITAVGTAAGNPTTLWQPLPDGPVVTFPVGSTRVPVTSIAGFEVGQKMAIGYGAKFPAVAGNVEKYEIVTVSEIGKAGAQTWLAANAPAGGTSIRLRGSGSVSVGDKIRLDINSLGHGIETVTIKSIIAPPTTAPAAGGAQTTPATGPATTQGGRGRGGPGGRGGGVPNLELEAPLKFAHASNMPVSVWGTGIKVQAATKFAHSSNEPVMPLGTGITLDRPLSNDQPIHAVVQVTATAAAVTPKPNQWFGGPAIPAAGNMVLRDAAGLVVDSLNFGAMTDPWAAEGYHGVSGSGRGGCGAPNPAGRGGGGRGGATTAPAGPRSASRTTDGTDTDSNCNDFRLQPQTPGAPNQAAQ